MHPFDRTRCWASLVKHWAFARLAAPRAVCVAGDLALVEVRIPSRFRLVLTQASRSDGQHAAACCYASGRGPSLRLRISRLCGMQVKPMEQKAETKEKREPRNREVEEREREREEDEDEDEDQDQDQDEDGVRAAEMGFRV